MTDRLPTSGPIIGLAAVEQARAQLEVVLRDNAHWRDLLRATLPAHRAALERALAGNPVFHAWELLGRAIGELQDARNPGDVAAGAAGQQRAARLAPTEAPAGRRRARVELRDVLERLKGEAPRGSAGEPAPAGEDEGGETSPARLGIASAPARGSIEIEEATVSFVIRESPGGVSPPAQRASEQGDGPSNGPDPGSNPAPVPSTPAPADTDIDAEITIVRRRR